MIFGELEDVDMVGAQYITGEEAEAALERLELAHTLGIRLADEIVD